MATQLVFVPHNSSVHSVLGKIFDRNRDGDFNIIGRDAQVAHLYLLKQMNDLKLELIRKVKNKG